MKPFVKMLVYDDRRELCMSRDCDDYAECFEHKIKNNIIDKERFIKWTLWSTSPSHQILKVNYTGTVLEYVHILSSKMMHFSFCFYKTATISFF